MSSIATAATAARFLRPSSRALHKVPAATTQARFLSVQGQQSVGKFRQALEDYRAKNYTRTFPPRFKKEIADVVRATSTSSVSPDGVLPIDVQKEAAIRDIERLLQNIGALGDDRVTHRDVEIIVSEIGADQDLRAEKIVTQLL